jgi:hypothetical protein
MGAPIKMHPRHSLARFVVTPKRWMKRYRGQGAEGLVHGNAGRRSRHVKPEALREKSLQLKFRRLPAESGTLDTCGEWSRANNPPIGPPLSEGVRERTQDASAGGIYGYIRPSLSCGRSACPRGC